MKIKIVLLIISLFKSNILLSEWSTNPAENSSVIAKGTRYPVLVSDMNSGAILIC